MTREDVFDFIIVGSGAGSVPAALVMKQAGKRPLILEKRDLIGGTSAFSGGMIWIPGSDYMKSAGVADSAPKARQYLDAVIGEPLPSSTPAHRDAYVRYAPEVIRFLADHGLKYRYADLPDYYDELPGGMAHGRAIVPRVFDINQLGEWGPKLGGFPMTQSYPTEGADAPKAMQNTIEGNLIKLKIGWRILQNKFLGRKIRGFGNALMGQLFRIALDAGVPIWTETKVKDFLIENGRVVGVVADRGGKEIRLRAELGVLLNAGGFARNLEMRERYQPKPTSVNWTLVNPGDTGEIILKAMEIGAATSLMDEAFWFPSSFMPDGKVVAMHAMNDLSKPGTIVVDKQGKRFVNEGISHMEVGRQMYASGAVPAWSVFDERRRQRYSFGMQQPAAVERLVKAGYLTRADSLDALAAACGIDAEGLKATVARFNTFASSGVDEDFHRGESVYQRSGGDASLRPNPSLAALTQPPFYAITLYPGDVGTCGGVLTDDKGRVMHENGSPIAGLYACGNTTATIMGHAYPGGGVTLGPSMTFAYLAARDAARVN